MNCGIVRDPAGSSAETYDVVIVGGGIYGAMLLLEATRAGLRCLLLERADFGSATSANHFRIIHGGLRYLQSLDVWRFRESVRERRWFLSTFPDLVEPLRCVMPLYGESLRRPLIMRPILRVNDLLSADRNRSVALNRRLPAGAVIGRDEALALYPDLPSTDLQGAAVWYDAVMRHSNRVLLEAIRWACDYGARAHNYVEAVDILEANGVAAGVAAIDQETGKELEYRATAVINAAGPWSRSFSAKVDRGFPQLFRESLAWNVLFDRPPLGAGALAVKPPGGGRRTYFMAARDGRLFVGTGHGSCDSVEKEPNPTEAQIDGFLRDLNDALPSLQLSLSDVVRVFAGHMPVKRDDSVRLSDRPVLIDHGRQGGLKRLYSLSGVKYTTARVVAERAIGGLREHSFSEAPKPQFVYDGPRQVRLDYRVSMHDDSWRDACEAIVAEEAVQHLDDLVMRRTDLADHPDVMRTRLDELSSLFPWSAGQIESEKQRLMKHFRVHSGSTVT